MKNRRKNPLSNKNHDAYDTWQTMRQRCMNPKNTSYYNYGGRGIFVCKEWDSFTTFIRDMGEKPTLKHQIDRINNNDGYYKENCRWVIRSMNMTNKRRAPRRDNGLPVGVHVTFEKNFKAVISINNTTYVIGTYKTIDKAIEERRVIFKEWFGYVQEM